VEMGNEQLQRDFSKIQKTF
jgi:hypothetical protein